MLTTKKQQTQYQRIARYYNLKPLDIGCLCFLSIAVSVYAYQSPTSIAIFLTCLLTSLSLYQTTKNLGFLKTIGIDIKWWHTATLTIISTTLVSTIFHSTPANAVFLSGLEEFFKSIAEGVSDTNTGDTAGINDETISLVFNMIRGVFLLSVIAAGLFAFNQAQQGNDWRPIIGQVGIAFGIVLAIDIITFIIAGDGSGTGGGS